jgi:hypothetical protein
MKNINSSPSYDVLTSLLRILLLNHIFHEFKGTVSPDIGLHFWFWKIKLVLSAGPLVVFTFFYFVVPEILKN